MQLQDKVKAIYYALDEKKANDIVIMDIQRVSMISDFFVIASGENQNQMQAMADNVQEEMEKNGVHFRHIEGYPKNDWILMDYNDVIVHHYFVRSSKLTNIGTKWH